MSLKKQNPGCNCCELKCDDLFACFGIPLAFGAEVPFDVEMELVLTGIRNGPGFNDPFFGPWCPNGCAALNGTYIMPGFWTREMLQDTSIVCGFAWELNTAVCGFVDGFGNQILTEILVSIAECGTVIISSSVGQQRHHFPIDSITCPPDAWSKLCAGQAYTQLTQKSQDQSDPCSGRLNGRASVRLLF